MRSSRFITVMWVLTAIFCVVLVTDIVPWIRGVEPWLPGDLSWKWNYDLPRWGWLIVSILGVLLYVVGVTRLLENYDDADSRYPVRLILWAFVGTTLITLLVMAIEQNPLYLLFTRSTSLVTGGYQYASVMMPNLGDTLRHWPDFVATYRQKYWINSVTTSPPGIDVLYYASDKLFTTIPALGHAFGSLVRPTVCQDDYLMSWSNGQLAAAWPQMAMPLWSSLAVAPLYNVGVMVFNRKIARQAVALWALTPGLILFSPRFNVFFPLIAIVMLSLTWRGLTRGRWQPIFWAGFAFGVGTFLNLVNVPLGLLVGLTIIGWGLINRNQWREVIRGLVVFGIGSTIMWLVYWLVVGLSLSDILKTIFGYHFVVTNRPWWPWIIQHPIDMFLFIGFPVSVILVWRLWLLIKQRKLLTRADVFVGAALITVVALDLSGFTQGESGRLWLIFAPAWLLLGADLLTRLDRPKRLALIAMQTAVFLSMGAVLRVHFTALTIPATPQTTAAPYEIKLNDQLTVPAAMQAATTPAQFPVNSQFVRGKDSVTLVGIDVVPAPAQVTLRLHWRADSFVSRPYYLSIVPVPPDKSYHQAMTWKPGGWRDNSYPPSCWLPGEEFVDSVTVPLGDKPQPGDWLFSLSISDIYTNDSMTIAGQTTTQVGIGPVHVPAA